MRGDEKTLINRFVRGSAFQDEARGEMLEVQPDSTLMKQRVFE